ncbi:hypothetical protein D8771_26550 [Streptomyces albus]|uniref:Uncharacterized protein n=1 Tax=Streptomyces albus TaxID=1888 RepID=A0A8H1QLJ8_9ACTN|nr:MULTISPECIES: hypothetical protein [Streptomyces]TGG77861.1 hypothetical protein D8771_26550 [Streptomyces albus]TXJ73564.1 hypothetical protein E2C11_29060 [Streptomyces lavendulae]
MSITFGTMPHICTGGVTAAVEAYSPAGGLAHGSLDATAYVCPAHVDTARTMWTDQGLMPFTAQAAKPNTTRCGAITDFRDSTVTPA